MTFDPFNNSVPSVDYNNKSMGLYVAFCSSLCQGRRTLAQGHIGISMPDGQKRERQGRVEEGRWGNNGEKMANSPGICYTGKCAGCTCAGLYNCTSGLWWVWPTSRKTGDAVLTRGTGCALLLISSNFIKHHLIRGAYHIVLVILWKGHW